MAILERSFLARLWNVRLLSTQAATDDLAFWVLAAELLVDPDLGVFGSERTKGARLQVFDPGQSEGLLLLYALKSGSKLVVEE
jgi:hypothetical protein